MRVDTSKQLMFNFEKLEVWQRAVDFADLVYATTRGFPREELFGLAMQMRRAAVCSVFEFSGGKFAVLARRLRQIYRVRYRLTLRGDLTERYRKAARIS